MNPPIDRQLNLFESRPPSTCSTVGRYRLSLVEEEETPYMSGVPMTRPERAAEWFSHQIGLRPQEHMVAAFLNSRAQLIGWTIAYVGTLNRAMAEPRTILQTGLLINAASFLLAHNHPSGDPTPSAEDIAVTRRLASAGDIVGVQLVDHLVIGHEGRWVSLQRRCAW